MLWLRSRATWSALTDGASVSRASAEKSIQKD